MLLLCSLVVLLNRISLIDRYFDTHKDACNYTFLYSIRTLKYLFEDHNEVNSTTSEAVAETFEGESFREFGDVISGIMSMILTVYWGDPQKIIVFSPLSLKYNTTHPC